MGVVTQPWTSSDFFFFLPVSSSYRRSSFILLKDFGALGNFGASLDDVRAPPVRKTLTKKAAKAAGRFHTNP